MAQPIFVFDSTRLRSHLFFRYLSTHPDLQPIYHPFLSAAMFGPDKISNHLEHSEMRKEELATYRKTLVVPDTYAENIQKLVNAVQLAKESGKVPLLNEHWFNIISSDIVLRLLRGDISESEQLGPNPTLLPDELFHDIRPIILIRHPALSVNSIYKTAFAVTKTRPGDEDFELICINKPLRLLYDYFKARDRKPIVVDGEDLLWRTKDLNKQLCSKLDLSSDGLSDKWEPTSKEEVAKINSLVYMITKDIHDSSGIVRPAEKPQEPSIEKAVEQWTQTYGTEVAEQLRPLAEACMPHYEYLKQFKI